METVDAGMSFRWHNVPIRLIRQKRAAQLG